MRSRTYARALFALAIAGVLTMDPSFILGQGRRPPLPQDPLTAVVDGQIRTGLYVVYLENIPCLSLRDMQKLYGGRQSWRRVARRVDFEVYGHTVGFSLDSSTVSVNGKELPLETQPRFWTGQLYVPVSFLLTEEFQSVSQTRNYWNAGSKSLTVEPVPSVSSPRYYSYPDKSRLMFELGPRVTHRVMGYRDGRLYVRFFGGRPTSGERLEVRDGLLEDIQVTPRGRSADLTVAFSKTAGAPRVFLEEGGRHWVMEVVPGPVSADADIELSAPVVLPAMPAGDLPDADGLEAELAEDDAPVPASPLLANSPIRTIVIDAGHGGKDAGAVGAHGTLEKDVNLEIARALARVLKRERRFRVIMTRNSDEFLALEERTDIANKQKADMFVSIHSNSALSKRSNGFEIYFLSEKATDEGAAAVARRENAVVELEGVTGKAKQKLQELLWSLAKTEAMNESAEVAALMVRQVDRRLGIPNRGVKQAGFYVLKGAAMPAVLVEAAFISHPREEGMLRSKRFQNKLADGLYAGLIDYEKRKVQARTARASD